MAMFGIYVKFLGGNIQVGEKSISETAHSSSKILQKNTLGFSRCLEALPSLKLTYPLKIDPWKRRFLLETIIFRGYVSFRECNGLSPQELFGGNMGNPKTSTYFFSSRFRSFREPPPATRDISCRTCVAKS